MVIGERIYLGLSWIVLFGQCSRGWPLLFSSGRTSPLRISLCSISGLRFGDNSKSYRVVAHNRATTAL